MSGVSVRAVCLGALLIPLLVFWSEYVEIKAAGPDMISTSIILCLLFALTVLLGINALLRRVFPKAAFTGRELLVVYAMGGVGISPAGIGMMQWLVSALPARAKGKFKESDYLIPEWTRVTDKEAAKAFYAGQTTWWEHIREWLMPMLLWSVFLLVLFFAMFCVSVLLRKQWVERERLGFPLVQLPLELIGGADAGEKPLNLWRSPVFWLGAALPVVLQGLAAIHFTFAPTIPFFPMKPNDMPDVQGFFSEKPWSAVGYLKLTFYPFVVGLAYLLALEISFSCWATYWLLKLLAVITFAFGINDGNGADLWNTKTFPLLGDQSVGAFIGLALLSLFLAKGHLRETLRTALGEPGGADDSGEAISYRTAWIGLVVSFGALVLFGRALGMPFGFALLFFGVFLLVVIGFSRIRAEAGVPWGYGPPMNVNGFVVDALGTANWSKEALGGFSSVVWMDADYRSTQMPYQIEALKIGDAARIAARRLTVALAIALVIGIASAWISQLAIYYHFGGDNGLQRTNVGDKFPKQLENWLSNTKPTDWGRIAAVGGGAGVVWLLAWVRTIYTAFPFHPIGFVVSTTWTMQWLWLPMFIGWLCKSILLRYGGMPAYRGALPFFLGLVLGDYTISGALALFYTFTDVPGYRTFPV
ncbi:MAG: hypothetical protein OHK0029_31160 [Armatimonadaceae bacterium]